MKVDGIGVLVNDDDGTVKEPKLGKRGIGIGVALGLVGAIPTAATPQSEGSSEPEAPPSASSSARA